LVKQIQTHAEVVTQLPYIRRSDDPADDFLLVLSKAGPADYLVTGDKARLRRYRRQGRITHPGRHRGTVILTARALLDTLTR